MKKVLLALSLVMMVSVAGFASKLNGVGIYGNLIGSGAGAFGGGIGATLKFGTFPVLGVEYMLAQKASQVGVSCDWWVVNNPLAGALWYYLGVGGFVSIGNAVDFGGRIPIGVQMFPLDALEVFLEIAPMVGFIPSISLGISMRLGFRVRF